MLGKSKHLKLLAVKKEAHKGVREENRIMVLVSEEGPPDNHHFAVFRRVQKTKFGAKNIYLMASKMGGIHNLTLH